MAYDHKAACRAYYQANKTRLVALQKQRRLENPEERKAHDAKYREVHAEKVRASKERYRLANLGKVKAAKVKWRLENPEKMQQARDAWELANPEKKQVHRENRRARERAASGRMSPGIIGKLFFAQQGKCAACRVIFKGRMELDHILPLSLGGSNDDSNIQLLCRTCNRSKGKKHPADFMRSKGLLL